MPYYPFECSSCSHQFEALVQHDEAAVCTECGSTLTKQLVVSRIFMRPSNTRRGRLMNFGSNTCPCGCALRKKTSA